MQAESFGRSANDPNPQSPNQTANRSGGPGIGYRDHAYQRLEQELLWQEAMWSTPADTTTTTTTATSSSSSSHQNWWQNFQEWARQHIPAPPVPQLSPLPSTPPPTPAIIGIIVAGVIAIGVFCLA